MSHIGRTIANYRKMNQMTIREFADHSEISTSLISQLERGKGNPSLHVLERLAQALGIPLFTLFINDIDPATLISRKAERHKVYREDNAHIVYDVLTPDFMNTNLEMLMMEIKPCSNTTESHYVHDAKEEIAVIMNGHIQVELEGTPYRLSEGDVVRIPKHIRHRFINDSEDFVKVLFVLTPSFY